MSRIPGLAQLLEKAPELATPRGALRATVTVLGTGVVALSALLYLEAITLFAAFVLQLAIYGVAYRLARQAIFGLSERRSYAQALFMRLLPAAGLLAASLVYIVLAGSRAPLGPGAGLMTDLLRLVPPVVAGPLAIYLAATGIVLILRTLQAAGVDTLALLYCYYPDEGRRLAGGVYGLLRHPMYSGLDRLALAFGLWRGSSYAMLMAVLFVFVWHPIQIALEERELVSRFGNEYEAYRSGLPAALPTSLRGELALLEALTRRPTAAGETQ